MGRSQHAVMQHVALLGHEHDRARQARRSRLLRDGLVKSWVKRLMQGLDRLAGIAGPTRPAGSRRSSSRTLEQAVAARQLSRRRQWRGTCCPAPAAGRPRAATPHSGGSSSSSRRARLRKLSSSAWARSSTRSLASSRSARSLLISVSLASSARPPRSYRPPRHWRIGVVCRT